MAREANRRGAHELTLISHPDNRAVPAVLHRSGLRARIARVDGLSRYTVSLRGLRRDLDRSADRASSAGQPVADNRSVVGLLHRRGELRSVYPTADVIDAALRDGA